MKGLNRKVQSILLTQLHSLCFSLDNASNLMIKEEPFSNYWFLIIKIVKYERKVNMLFIQWKMSCSTKCAMFSPKFLSKFIFFYQNSSIKQNSIFSNILYTNTYTCKYFIFFINSHDLNQNERTSAISI